MIERLYLNGTIITERRLETFIARKRPGRSSVFWTSHRFAADELEDHKTLSAAVKLDV